jgi:hypothetical protein
MHHVRLWIACGLLAAFAGNAAVVYKWTDADGVVHFSDQPVPGAEKLDVGVGSTRTGNMFGEKLPPPKAATEKPNPTKPADYIQFGLSSPLPDQSFFNDDIVTAHLDLDPALLANHSITWYLDGSALTDQSPEAVTIILKGLPRGTYTVSATVFDAQSQESRNSQIVTFYMREPSALSPQHK